MKSALPGRSRTPNAAGAIWLTSPRNGSAREPRRRTADYYRRFVLPWIGRRLTGRSSGDGRAAKIAELTPVDPASAQPL